MRLRTKSLVVRFGLGILFAVAVLAQDTGSITGTVRDVTGAVIPGAKVTLRNTAQGSIYRTISNSDGDYRRLLRGARVSDAGATRGASGTAYFDPEG